MSGEVAIQLLKDALFLRMNGERPPGAPHDDPKAETWHDWDMRCESFLRGQSRSSKAHGARDRQGR